MRFVMYDYASFKTAMDNLRLFLLENALSQECIFNSKLIATELLGNVLQHSDGKASITVDVEDEVVVLQILSEKPFLPTLPKTLKKPEVSAERGRGLYLVDCLSVDWIVGENGTMVIKVKK